MCIDYDQFNRNHNITRRTRIESRTKNQQPMANSIPKSDDKMCTTLTSSEIICISTKKYLIFMYHDREQGIAFIFCCWFIFVSFSFWKCVWCFREVREVRTRTKKFTKNLQRKKCIRINDDVAVIALVFGITFS